MTYQQEAITSAASRSSNDKSHNTASFAVLIPLYGPRFFISLPSMPTVCNMHTFESRLFSRSRGACPIEQRTSTRAAMPALRVAHGTPEGFEYRVTSRAAHRYGSAVVIGISDNHFSFSKNAMGYLLPLTTRHQLNAARCGSSHRIAASPTRSARPTAQLAVMRYEIDTSPEIPNLWR